MDDDIYATVLESYVNTLSLWEAKVHAEKVPGLDHLVFAKRCGISPEKALNTIHQTTQHGVCTVLHPSLSRQFKTNNRQLWYRRLPHNMYSDTLLATTVSRRGNRCTQIFATNFGWSCLFLMRLKSEAHEAFSLLFQQDGCCLQWYVTMPKKWPLVSLTEDSRRHPVIWSRQSHSPHGQMTPETVWEENPKGILQGFPKPWVATARNLPDS